MRLAHIAQEDSRLPPGPASLGSLTRVVHELTTRLARRQPLTVYATRFADDAAEERRGDVRYVRVPAGRDTELFRFCYRWRNRIGRRVGLDERPFASTAAYYRSYIRRIARRVAGDRPDVVHLHNVTQFIPPLRAAVPRAKLVLQMHCEWLVELPRATIAPRLAATDLILGVSSHVVRQVQEAFPAHAARCRVLHNGVDLARFPTRERTLADRSAPVAALRARLGIRGPVVLYVGRLSSEKGVHLLLEAFDAVRARWPEATCILAGPDWGPLRRVAAPGDALGRELARLDRDYMGHLQRLAAPHGERVVFAGGVPNRDLALYYAVADVVAAPSLLEAFGLPAIEAAASGVPVVAAATGGLLDTVVPGTTGLFVPPGDPRALADAVTELFADPDRARALGRAARDCVAAQFTWDRIADTLAGYYDDLQTARRAA